VRVRIRFSKLGKVRWTSHRDLARMWERAFRRVDFPLAYTCGFSPRPKVSFGLALPTGHESLAEYLDVELAEGADPATLGVGTASFTANLSAALPAGVDAVAAALVEPGALSLQEAVGSCTWSFAAAPAGGGVLDPDDLAARVGQLLAAGSVTVELERKGRRLSQDIRPAVLAARVVHSGDPALARSGPPGELEAGGSGPGRSAPAGPTDADRELGAPVAVGGGAAVAAGAGLVGVVRLEAELACRPRSLRPSELLAALGPDLEERDPRRTHQWIWRDGARTEPLPAPAVATSAPRATACVS